MNSFFVIYIAHKFLAFPDLHFFWQEQEITVYLLQTLGTTNINMKDVSFVTAIIMVLYEFLSESIFFFPFEIIYRKLR